MPTENSDPQSIARPARTLPWRDCETLPLKIASEASGVSVTSLYRHAEAGRLKFKTLSGRTLVVTESLIALIDDAPDWTPSDRGKEARAKRREIARAALQG